MGLHGSLEVAGQLVHTAQHAVTEAAALSSSAGAVSAMMRLWDDEYDAEGLAGSDGHLPGATWNASAGVAGHEHRRWLQQSGAAGCPTAVLTSAPRAALVLSPGDTSVTCDTRLPSGNDVLLGRLVAGGWGSTSPSHRIL